LGEGRPKTETPVRTALIVLALFCLPSWSLASPQSAPANSSQEKSVVVRLEPGKTLEKTLAGGASDSYEIQVGAGQFLHAVVDQLGIDVALTLYGPDGRTIAAMDSPNGAFGLEQISAIADSTGAYRLEIASGDKDARPAAYRISINPLQPPTAADQARISAERNFAEAAQLQAEGSSASLRSALHKYDETLPLWRSAGDAYEEILTLNNIGSI
jgi:hypothetical protein